MPFDPSYPPAHAEIESAPLRAQFLALKALIDALGSVTSAQVDAVTTGNPGDPAAVSVSLVGTGLHFSFTLPRGMDGTEGPMGLQGPPFASAVMDGVTTLNPGEPASAQVSFDGTNVHFAFSIPRGNDGNQGTPGQDGGQGPQGIQGPSGPPFASAVVDGVTTLNPGDAATVQTSFDGSSVHFSFGIPRGETGSAGEVSQADLATAVATTSPNTNAVSTLGFGVSDPPTQAEMQQILDKVNELILNGRR